ncbi:MAG: glycosyltransferase family 2 protein [Aureliella sp.]
MESHSRTPVTVVVLTFNEEINVQRCLESVAGWAQEIVVVDSFSTDATVEIARRYTDRVVQHKYEGHAQQWGYALKELEFSTEWIFAMDADFVLTDGLRKAIDQAIASENATDIHGYYVRHKQIFRGKFIRFGTIYPRYWLRLFRHGKGFVDELDLVDLHFYVDGKTAKLEYDLIEDNHKERDIGFWVNKQVKFAKKQALEELKRLDKNMSFPVRPSLFGSPDQRTLWLKSRWYRMPLFIRPILYFVYRYFLRLGFLDGREGFVYHFTQALLYRLLVDIELYDLRAARAAERSKGEAQ